MPQLSEIVSSGVDMPNFTMPKKSVVIPKCGVIISKGSVVMSKCGVDLSKLCVIICYIKK